MAKAILVLDEMPKSCDECNFLLVMDIDGVQPEKYFCGIPQIGENVEDYDSCRPDFCPLRPMPEVKPGKNLPKYDTDMRYEMGWNDAIRAIEGSGK